MTTTTKSKKAAPASKSASTVTTIISTKMSVHLSSDDQEGLDRHAKKAGTTGTNLARILIRHGLEKLASGEFKITVPVSKEVVKTETSPGGEVQIDFHPDGSATATIFGNLAKVATRHAKQHNMTLEELLAYSIRESHGKLQSLTSAV